jgi:hypothetical protein
VIEQETLAAETKNLRTTLLARVAHLQLLGQYIAAGFNPSADN